MVNEGDAACVVGWLVSAPHATLVVDSLGIVVCDCLGVHSASPAVELDIRGEPDVLDLEGRGTIVTGQLRGPRLRVWLGSAREIALGVAPQRLQPQARRAADDQLAVRPRRERELMQRRACPGHVARPR